MISYPQLLQRLAPNFASRPVLNTQGGHGGSAKLANIDIYNTGSDLHITVSVGPSRFVEHYGNFLFVYSLCCACIQSKLQAALYMYGENTLHYHDYEYI